MPDAAELRAAIARKPTSQAELEEWVRGFERFGQSVLVRAAVAAAELVLPRFESTLPERTEVRAAIDAARAWLACPCDEHAKEAETRADGAFETTDVLAYDDDVAGGAANAAGWAAKTVGGGAADAAIAARAAFQSLCESPEDADAALDRVYSAITNGLQPLLHSPNCL